MVLDSGRVKIMDFGIAHLPTGSRTWAGTLLGSPKYMAPERIAARQVDGRADIFSLGAVLYEMLTGCPPFVGDNLEALLDEIIHKTPASPRSRNPSIPFGFDYVVTTSMAKRPDDRYPDASAMASAVRNFRDPRPPAFVPEELVPSARSPAAGAAASPKDSLAGAAAAVRIVFGQRQRLVVFGGAAAVLVLVASAALLSRRTPDDPPPASRDGTVAAPAKDLMDANPGAPEVRDDEGELADRVTPVAVSSSESLVPRQPTAVAAPTARVGLAVTPWGEVYVDGKRKGVAPPLTEIRVAPGKHTIEIRNTTFPSYAQSIDLAANVSLKIRHKFQ
jgi:serine/threonine-protein kinase